MIGQQKQKITYPKRIQRRRVKGWRMPPNTLYVGRPTKWGNPYRIDELSHDDPPQPLMAKECVELFEIYTVPELIEDGLLEELRDKNLSCWCKIGEPCHADVLLRMANR